MAADHLTFPEGCAEIPGFPAYCVRADGAVFSRRVYGSKSRRLGPWWRMKVKTRRSSLHEHVDLFREVGKPERWWVHQLVLLAFVGPCPSGQECLHRNDIGNDNRLSNLRYGTRFENQADALANGRYPLGEDRPMAKRTNEEVRAIRAAAEAGVRRKEIRARFGLNSPQLSAILCRRVYKHVW